MLLFMLGYFNIPMTGIVINPTIIFAGLFLPIDGLPFPVKIDSIADTYVGKYIFMPLKLYNEKFKMPQGSYLGLWSLRRGS